MKTRFLPSLATLVCCSSPIAHAAVSDADFARLQEQMQALASRLQALEVENAELRDLVAEPQADGAAESGAKPVLAATDWGDRLSVSGDFRYRYEEIKLEDADRRQRDRIRARVNLKARITDSITLTTGVSTGGDDPISTNQTLGNVGSRKDLRLNLAYVDWAPVEGWSITAGKMKNQFYRPQRTALIWDGDYTPEGMGAAWANEQFFFNAAGNWLESDSRGGGKQLAWGLQGGVNLELGSASLTTGVSYFDLPVHGDKVFFGGPNEFYGNSFSCDDLASLEGCVYLYDYEELEWFADLGMEVAGRPLHLYTDVVQNQAVDEFDTGWMVGLNYGKAKARGTWQVGYEYRDLEADAVFGILSDSDFAGGGTDGRGHIVRGRYVPVENVAFDVTWFINNHLGDDLFSDGRSLSFDRVMLDASFRF